jgi:protein SCO1/2
MGKSLRIIIAAGALVASALLVWFAWLQPYLTKEDVMQLGQGEYSLIGTDGQPFTQATLQGAPSAVFFGFTHCPEVCPTTLGDIAVWQDELGEEAQDLRVFFVTVDPERDTAELLGDYVGWVPGVVGVTGDTTEIRAAEKAFRIYSRKIPLSDGEYTMDHSAYVLLFDDQGLFFEPITYQEDLDRALSKLRRLLG